MWQMAPTQTGHTETTAITAEDSSTQSWSRLHGVFWSLHSVTEGADLAVNSPQGQRPGQARTGPRRKGNGCEWALTPSLPWQILTMYYRFPETGEATCNLYHLNATLRSALKGKPGPKDAQPFVFVFYFSYVSINTFIALFRHSINIY